MNGIGEIFESIFNVLYLTAVWGIVILMIKNRERIAETDRPLGGCFLLAFGLLAFGDSFHVGARIVNAIIGPEAATVNVGGIDSSFLGLGMMVTAYTMTFFYMILAWARKIRSGGKADPAFWIMQTLLAARLVIMALPGNAWELAVPPYAMGLVRNLPLAIAGFLMAFLYIREGGKDADRAWKGFGWAMVASYLCYGPVILFAAFVPALGTLMIPKTVAYLVMGIIAYNRFWGRKA